MYNEYDDEQKQNGSGALNKMRNGAKSTYDNGKKLNDYGKRARNNDNNNLKNNKLGEHTKRNPNREDNPNENGSNGASSDLNNKAEANDSDNKKQNNPKTNQNKQSTQKGKEGAENAKKAGEKAKKTGDIAASSGKAAATGGASLAIDAAKEKVKGLFNALKKYSESKAANEEVDPEVKKKIVRKLIFWFVIIFIFFGPYIINLLFTSHMINGFRSDLPDNIADNDFSFTDNAEDAKDEVDDAFKKAYDMAYNEAQLYCEENGANWEDSEATLESNNSSSWKEVYADSNYIDLCNMISLIHEGLDFDSYDKKTLKKYIKSDEVISHLYYIGYEKQYYEDTEGEDDNGEESDRGDDNEEFYYNITIYPFSEWNLTQIIDKDIYDLVDFNELSNYDENEDLISEGDNTDPNVAVGEDDGNTFDDYMTTSRIETIATLQEIDDDNNINEDVINELNGYNETPKYPIVNTTGTVGYYEELEEYEDMDLGSFDTNEWYTDVPVEAEGKGDKVKTVDGWLELYDAPTEKSSSSSYYVNTALARSDIQEDVASKVSNMNSTSVPRAWSSIEYYSATNDGSERKMHGVKWEIGTGTAATKNGRYLIAVAPGIVNENYWQKTGGIGNSSSWYDYGSKKMDLVVIERSSGTQYYIPVTTGDSKAHSFPYGISQTGVRIPGLASENLVGSDFSSDAAIRNFGTAKDYGSALDSYSIKLQSNTGYTISQWLAHGVVEWCSPGGGKSVASSRISNLHNNYDLLGIIVY